MSGEPSDIYFNINEFQLHSVANGETSRIPPSLDDIPTVNSIIREGDESTPATPLPSPRHVSIPSGAVHSPIPPNRETLVTRPYTSGKSIQSLQRIVEESSSELEDSSSESSSEEEEDDEEEAVVPSGKHPRAGYGMKRPPAGYGMKRPPAGYGTKRPLPSEPAPTPAPKRRPLVRQSVSVTQETRVTLPERPPTANIIEYPDDDINGTIERLNARERASIDVLVDATQDRYIKNRMKQTTKYDTFLHCVSRVVASKIGQPLNIPPEGALFFECAIKGQLESTYECLVTQQRPLTAYRLVPYNEPFLEGFRTWNYVFTSLHDSRIPIINCSATVSPVRYLEKLKDDGTLDRIIQLFESQQNSRFSGLSIMHTKEFILPLTIQRTLLKNHGNLSIVSIVASTSAQNFNSSIIRSLNLALNVSRTVDEKAHTLWNALFVRDVLHEHLTFTYDIFINFFRRLFRARAHSMQFFGVLRNIAEKRTAILLERISSEEFGFRNNAIPMEGIRRIFSMGEFSDASLVLFSRDIQPKSPSDKTFSILFTLFLSFKLELLSSIRKAVADNNLDEAVRIATDVFKPYLRADKGIPNSIVYGYALTYYVYGRRVNRV